METDSMLFWVEVVVQQFPVVALEEEEALHLLLEVEACIRMVALPWVEVLRVLFR
jgi:hypothetical protein